jgi:hypothetical protein
MLVVEKRRRRGIFVVHRSQNEKTPSGAACFQRQDAKAQRNFPVPRLCVLAFNSEDVAPGGALKIFAPRFYKDAAPTALKFVG